MNTLLKDALMILIGILGGYLFVLIRQKVITQTKEVVGEKFNLSKFSSGMLNVVSPVGWAKDIQSIFNLRKLIIIGVIIGCIYGYGFWKGQQGKPVQIKLDYATEMTIPIPGDGIALHKPKNSYGLEWIDTHTGKVIAVVKVKDIPGLAKKLRPFGFHIKPIGVLGGGVGTNGIGFEGGAGLSWLKYFKWRAESFITNKGLYPMTIAYKITDNSGIGLGAGFGFKDAGKRAILYYRWEF